MKHINAFLIVSFLKLSAIIHGNDCLHLGMLSPIEVVEEWGCHDTEIRLTCGHLDSKVAILEATFSPNCSQENCLHFDMKRLVRTFAPQQTADLQAAEKDAGRKFLETLRRTHSQDTDADVDIDVDFDLDDELEEKGALQNSNWTSSDASLSSSEVTHHQAQAQVAFKRKRTSLRTALERLIIRYLRKLSLTEELQNNARYARSRRNTMLLGRPRRKTVVASDEEGKTVNPFGGSHHELPTTTVVTPPDRQPTADDDDNEEDDDSSSSAEDLARIQETRSYCVEQKRLVSSLDKYDLLRSYQNESDDEYNIRRLLNKRCSGKNHCSFIFSIDHPFAKIWESGIVRVKYVCMEDFRMNRYCGEHLTIGYEIDPKVQVMQSLAGGLEPIAEARVQTRETALHSLKILKPEMQLQMPNSGGAGGDSFPLSNQSKKRKTNVDVPAAHSNKSKSNHEEKSRVYSQDFRVLKILPSNLDDFNDIEQIGDEIYFRKEEDDEDEKPSTTTSPMAANSAATIATTATTTTTTTTYQRESPHHQIDNNPYNPYQNPDASQPHAGGESNFTSGTEELPDRRWSSAIPTVNTSDAKITNHLDDSAKDDKEDEDEWENQEEDDAEEEDNSFEQREKSRKTYNSIQRTSYRAPLLHGFAMTPGYPKFYIGELDCKWNLLAPGGRQIRITLLDIALRYDNDCKDYIRIDDLGINRTLYTSCTESIRPVEVVSSSNWIEVLVKTTTKFAYPKRGVLLHYTVVGCVNPPLPLNGRLLERTETTATYECQPSFIFPDTDISTRKLTCNSRDIWDKLLPDCVEQEYVQSRIGIPSEINIKLIKKFPGDNYSRGSISSTSSNKSKKPINKMPTQNDADFVYDIIIPTILIAALFIINGAVFAVIMKYRKRHKTVDDSMELADL